MSNATTDARLFKVVSGVLGMTTAQVAQLAASQEGDAGQSWDSLQHINIILGLEAEFGIRFDLMEAIDMKTIPLLRARLSAT